MTRIMGEVTIGASIEEVFDVVADERNEPKYNPRIVNARRTSTGPIGIGARFVAEPKGGGPRAAMTMTILEYDRPHRLRTQVSSSYMQVDGVLTLDDVDGGTRLRWDWQMRLTGAMRLLSPMLALVGPRWEYRNWEGLKQYMEAGRR